MSWRSGFAGSSLEWSSQPGGARGTMDEVGSFSSHGQPLPVPQIFDDDCDKRPTHQTGNERSTAFNALEVRPDAGRENSIFQVQLAEDRCSAESIRPSEDEVHGHDMHKQDEAGLESDRTSTEVASSRVASCASSIISQVYPGAHESPKERPLDAQQPWSPSCCREQLSATSTLSLPSRSSSNCMSSISDLENESSSYFSCISTVSSSTQFHECEEWIGSTFDSDNQTKYLQMRRAAASSGDWNLETTSSDIETRAERYFGKTGGRAVGSLAEGNAVRENTESKYEAFGSINTGAPGAADESASDLMTSSDEDEGCDMSYSDWMTKTGEDIMFPDVPEPEQEYTECGKPPICGDTCVASCSTERDRKHWVGLGEEGNPHGCTNHQQLRHSTSFESSYSQFARSSVSEDSLGLMEQVVGLTLQGIRGTASWTDFSSTATHTPMSRSGELEISFDMHTIDRPVEIPESTQTQEQEVVQQQAPAISLLNVPDSDEVLPKASSSPIKPWEQQNVHWDEDKDECVRDNLDSPPSFPSTSRGLTHSRELSLGYLASDNPAYRSRLSLEALPGDISYSWEPILPEDLDSSLTPPRTRNEGAESLETAQRGFLDPDVQTHRNTTGGSLAHLDASADVAPTSETWRAPLRTFSSYSEPGNELEKSAKFRVRSWFFKQFSFSKWKHFPEPQVWLSEDLLRLKDEDDLRNMVLLESAGMINLDDGFEDAMSVDDEFSFDDAEELNKSLRDMAEFQSVDMGTWTSQMVGFSTPARYYAHMANELQEDGIDVMLAICEKLGEVHPLVKETAGILKNSRDTSKQIARTPTHRKSIADEIWTHTESKNEWGSAVLSALLQCGINAMFFDRAPTGFETVSEYYLYLSQKLRSEGVDIDCIIPKLEKRLGVEHPLMDALEKCMEINPSHYFVHGEEVHSPRKPDEVNSILASSNSASSFSPKPQSARKKTPRQRKSGVKRIKDFVKKKVFNGGRKRKKDTSSSSKEAVAGQKNQPGAHGKEQSVKDHTINPSERDSRHCDDNVHTPKHHRKCHSFSLKNFRPRLLKRSKPTSHVDSQGDESMRAQMLSTDSNIQRGRARRGLDVAPGDTWQGRGYSSMDNRRYGKSTQLSSEQAEDVINELQVGYPGDGKNRGMGLATIFDHSCSLDESPRSEYGDGQSKHQRSVSVNLPSVGV